MNNLQQKLEFTKQYGECRKNDQSKIQKWNSILKVIYYTNPIYGLLGDYDKYKYYCDALGLSKKLEEIIATNNIENSENSIEI